MTVSIDQDLKDILNKIDQKFEKLDQRFDKIDQKFENLQKDIIDLKIGQVNIQGDIKTLEEKLSGQIQKVDTKCDGLDKRLSDREFYNRGIFVRKNSLLGIGFIISFYMYRILVD
jgi:archaellum component FlaC